MKQYKTYRFKDQDPLIGEVMAELRDTKFSEVSRSSGVSTTTLYNWRKKKSRRTYASTLNAVARTAGKKLELTKL